MCAKNKESVAAQLRRMKSDTQKYRYLKENITMRVKGCGWEECKHAWSKGGRKYTIEELTAHMEKIFDLEAGWDVPDEPVVDIQKRAPTAILGTLNNFAKQLDGKYFDNEEEFKEACVKKRRQRVLRGIISTYSDLQPMVTPKLEDLVNPNKRIDVLCGCGVKNEETTLMETIGGARVK